MRCSRPARCGKTLPLHCVSTILVDKTVPFRAAIRSGFTALNTSGLLINLHVLNFVFAAVDFALRYFHDPVTCSA